MSGEPIPVETDPEAILRPGDVVDGKYKIDRLIGVGGMAAVWSGRNDRTGKRVALKVILRSLLRMPEVAARFRREALAMGRVNHPNVVTVFDVVEHEGLQCIIMELLEGESLIEMLDARGKLGEGEAVSLLLPAMRGVQAAHDQGVVHRDLKPHNIFICRTPNGSFSGTKVLDFGISKLKEENAPDPQAITMGGTVMGTPAYMAPEQVVAGREVDHRADVYALGIVLYQALAGRPPFAGEPYSAMIVRIATEANPPLESFRPDVSPGLKAVVEKAIAKDLADRYQSMTEFADALELWVRDEHLRRRNSTTEVSVPLVQPVVANNESERVEITATTPRRPPRSNVLVVAAWLFGGAIALLIGLGIGTLMKKSRPPVEPPVMVVAPPPVKPAAAVPVAPAPVAAPSPTPAPAAVSPVVTPATPALPPRRRAKVEASAPAGPHVAPTAPAAAPAPEPTPAPTPAPAPEKPHGPAHRAGTLSPEDF